MLPQLGLMRLRFALEITTETTLPPYKGDLLRRALLWCLGAIWCRQPERCRHGCQSPQTCLFGRLLEPPLDPSWSQPILRLMGATPPPAYVLWDEQDRRRRMAPGDPFHFELVLIGPAAIHQLPAFLAAMMVAAERGMGRQRLKGRLHRVEALVGPEGQAHPLLVDGAWQGDPVENLAFGLAEGQAWAKAVHPSSHGPLTRLRLRFLSPVKVKMRGTVARQPHFPALARAVVRRLRILSQVHGAGEWPPAKYGPLLDLADEVRLEHHETTWLRTSRYSQQGGGCRWRALWARPGTPPTWTCGPCCRRCGWGSGCTWGRGRSGDGGDTRWKECYSL